MAIFNSYVKLPEGISFVSSARNSQSMTLAKPLHRFQLRLWRTGDISGFWSSNWFWDDFGKGRHLFPLSLVSSIIYIYISLYLYMYNIYIIIYIYVYIYILFNMIILQYYTYKQERARRVSPSAQLTLWDGMKPLQALPQCLAA